MTATRRRASSSSASATSLLFTSGEATVLDELQADRGPIAATLDKEPGHIRIVGHTDNAPIMHRALPIELRTSVERAKAVAALLKPAITQPERIEVDGKGADSPIATNATPEGQRQEPARRDPHRSDRLMRCDAHGAPRIPSIRIGLDRHRRRSRWRRSSGSPARCCAFGEWRPFESTSCACAIAACDHLRRCRDRRLAHRPGAAGRRRRSRRRLTGPEADPATPPCCKERMKDALATLKTAQGPASRLPLRPALVRHHRPAGRRQDDGARQFRPEIPAGAAAPRPRPIAGVGGTRYCDWWFTEEAVLIDTAGRYTTQDSDAKADQQELARLPRPAQEEPAAPADQRRAGRHQHRGPADACRRRSSRRMPTRSARACSSCTSS